MTSRELEIINRLKEDNYEEPGYLYTKIKQILDMQFPGNGVKQPSDLPDYIHSLCQHIERSYGEDVTKEYIQEPHNKYIKAFFDRTKDNVTCRVIMPEMMYVMEINPTVFYMSRSFPLENTFNDLTDHLYQKLAEFVFEIESSKPHQYCSQKINCNIITSANVPHGHIFVHPVDFPMLLSSVSSCW
jgi:hypothetical protein